MNCEKWVELFARAFKSIDDRLGQVAQLQSCREHWIQAELSLYAYYHDRIDIWTEADIGTGARRISMHSMTRGGCQ